MISSQQLLHQHKGAHTDTLLVFHEKTSAQYTHSALFMSTTLQSSLFPCQPFSSESPNCWEKEEHTNMKECKSYLSTDPCTSTDPRAKACLEVGQNDTGVTNDAGTQNWTPTLCSEGYAFEGLLLLIGRAEGDSNCYTRMSWSHP